MRDLLKLNKFFIQKYFLVFKNNLMKKIKTITIIILLIPLKFYGQCFTFSIQTTPASCSTCCDGTASVVNFTGGCPPNNSVFWNNGFQLGLTTTELCPGNYLVSIFAPDSCCTHPDTVGYATVLYQTGISEPQYSYQIKTFITDDNLLIIENLNSEETIELFDIIGKKIFNSKNANSKVEINLNPLNKQIYILIVKDKNNGIVYHSKIIW